VNDFYGVAYGKGAFIAVGLGGIISSSPDGTNWTARTSGTTNDLQTVTFGNGLFVAMGANGSARTSTNGINWVGHLTGFNSASRP